MGPLRTLSVWMVALWLPFEARSQTSPPLTPPSVPDLEYRLGGAVTIAGRVPTRSPLASTETVTHGFRYPERLPASLLARNAQPFGMGRLSIFGSEEKEDGRDVLRLGTAFRQGRTTTGVSVTYGQDAETTPSEVFVDYALTKSLSVGLSGLLTEESRPADVPVTGLGISAAYTLEGGSFLQGGVADAVDTAPVFGPSLGLRF